MGACSVAQSCPTLQDPLDCSLPGFSVHGIFQTRILECAPFPSPGGLPDPGIEPGSPALQAYVLPSELLGKPNLLLDHFQFTLILGPNIPGSYAILFLQHWAYFYHQSHPQLGVVFALTPSLHSFWSYFSTVLQQHIGHLSAWGVHLSCHVGPPKLDGSWWRVLTKHGPLEKEMANHFSILLLRTQ